MTTETKTESTTPPASNDNKAVFGPLGKYAIVAVIMVSIIVTTAIMLDRQLKSVDEQIAAIEEEVAEMHAADTKDTNTIEVIAEVSAVVADTEIKQAEVKQEAVIETAAVVAAPETAPATTPAITEAVVETAEALPVQKTAAAPVETEAKQQQLQPPLSSKRYRLKTSHKLIRKSWPWKTRHASKLINWNRKNT